jgi:hypothetical protein
MTTVATQVEGIRTVSGSTERDTLFPVPATGQKVYNASTDQIEKWDGAAWVSVVTGLLTIPQGNRTVETLAAYLSNNAVYNVKDYGAKGDGVTQDHLAIQAAIDDAVLTGGIVMFPPGHYICGDTLVITGYGVTLQGAGSFGGSDIRGTRIELISVNRDLLQIKSSLTIATQSIVVQDIYFTGPGAAAGATGHGIHTFCGSATAQVLGRVELRRVAVSNFREHGVFFDGTLQHGGTWFQTLKQFVVSLNGKDGVRIDSLIQSVIEDGYILDNGNYGLNITGRNGAADYVSKAITVTRVSSETSGFYNLNLESCTGINLREIWLESPTLGQARFCSAQAIRWTGGQGAVEQAPSTYKGIYFTQNSHADPNSDIYIDVPNFDVHSTKKLVTFDGLAVTFSGGPVRFGRMGNNSNPEISRWINPDDITDFATYLNVIDFEGAGLRIIDPTTAQNGFAVYGEKNGVYGILGFRNAGGYWSLYGNGQGYLAGGLDCTGAAGSGIKLKSPDGTITKTLQLSNGGAVALV